MHRCADLASGAPFAHEQATGDTTVMHAKGLSRTDLVLRRASVCCCWTHALCRSVSPVCLCVGMRVMQHERTTVFASHLLGKGGSVGGAAAHMSSAAVRTPPWAVVGSSRQYSYYVVAGSSVKLQAVGRAL